jgi:transposase
MAKRRLTLTRQEICGLQRAEDTTQNVRELKRLQAVRLYGSGQTVEMIQEAVGCSWRALMVWCRAYRERGLAGLKSHWQGNTALKLTRDQRADLKVRLEQYQPDQVVPPDIRVSQGEFWTVSDLKTVVYQWYGVTYQSDTSYRTLLHECGLSQQKTEPQYRSRPNQQVVADFEAGLEKK